MEVERVVLQFLDGHKLNADILGEMTVDGKRFALFLNDNTKEIYAYEIIAQSQDTLSIKPIEDEGTMRNVAKKAYQSLTGCPRTRPRL